MLINMDQNARIKRGEIHAPRQLTREEVARRLGVYYRARFSGGSLWVDYDDQKRAYCVRGEGLDPHESMRVQYSNGWSMLHYEKPTEARKRVAAKTDAELIADGLAKAAQTKAEADAIATSENDAPRRTCDCGHPVSDHHPDFGTCREWPDCDCETCSVGPDDRTDRTQHAPLPWEVGGGPYDEKLGTYPPIITSECRDVATLETYYGDQEANAAFIVRAVNAHAQLVAALKSARLTIGALLDDLADLDGNDDAERVYNSQETSDAINAALKAAGE